MGWQEVMEAVRRRLIEEANDADQWVDERREEIDQWRQDRREDADGGISRRQHQPQRAQRHEDGAEQQGRPAAGTVGVAPDQQAAQRTGDEADAEHAHGQQQGELRRGGGEEHLADDLREKRVGDEVEELQAVADHHAQHRCHNAHAGQRIRYGAQRRGRLHFPRVMHFHVDLHHLVQVVGIGAADDGHAHGVAHERQNVMALQECRIL